jgi:hypothetical protein
MCVKNTTKQSSPATLHVGAWRERRESSHSFLTLTLVGVSDQRHAPAALCPGKGPPVTIVQEAGWASEPVCTQEVRGKILCPCRGSKADSPVVQSKVRHYTNWATPASKIQQTQCNFNHCLTFCSIRRAYIKYQSSVVHSRSISLKLVIHAFRELHATYFRDSVRMSVNEQ